METTMTKLKQLLPSNQASSFLQAMAQLHMPDYETYFIFTTPQKKRAFEEAMAYLASPETMSIQDLEPLGEEAWTLIAQTIDGDYILARSEETMVLPVSLYKKDTEIFPCPIIDFFIAYDEDEIDSNILAGK